MRLIDADALIDEIKYITGQDTIMWFDDRKIKREQEVNMAAFIGRAQTIDAVPVVRCKECKWWREETDHTCRKWGGASPRNANGYCDDGERSEDGHTD